MSVSNQAYIFLWSVLGGMLIAFVFDIFRIKRKTIKTNNFITYLEDLIYWSIAAGIMFAVVYISNEGEIRGYIFVGALIGAVLYILLLSKLVISISMKIIRLINRILRIIWRIISYPIRVILKFLSIPTVFLYKLILRFYRNSKRVAKINFDKRRIYKKIFRNSRKKI
ncbi:MAG: spore cortex biosynthesis protein YabQ [Bacillota bacterium]|nr:spore cortex biosynthesis protein YabQ [Bacillota bacterium]